MPRPPRPGRFSTTPSCRANGLRLPGARAGTRAGVLGAASGPDRAQGILRGGRRPRGRTRIRGTGTRRRDPGPRAPAPGSADRDPEHRDPRHGTAAPAGPAAPSGYAGQPGYGRPGSTGRPGGTGFPGESDFPGETDFPGGRVIPGPPTRPATPTRPASPGDSGFPARPGAPGTRTRRIRRCAPRGPAGAWRPVSKRRTQGRQPGFPEPGTRTAEDRAPGVTVGGPGPQTA